VRSLQNGEYVGMAIELTWKWQGWGSSVKNGVESIRWWMGSLDVIGSMAPCSATGRVFVILIAGSTVNSKM
jgi:hypothetical protein